MYMTEQRKKLFEFFKSHPDMTISARDLAAQLVAEEHAKISVSAVYRNLAMLEREGLILRSPGKNNRENVYRYVSLGVCEDKLHITCLKCGRTTHMTQKISDKLLKDVLRGDKFDIDLSKTTVYGICKDCR